MPRTLNCSDACMDELHANVPGLSDKADEHKMDHLAVHVKKQAKQIEALSATDDDDTKDLSASGVDTQNLSAADIRTKAREVRQSWRVDYAKALGELEARDAKVRELSAALEAKTLELSNAGTTLDLGIWVPGPDAEWKTVAAASPAWHKAAAAKHDQLSKMATAEGNHEMAGHHAAFAKAHKLAAKGDLKGAGKAVKNLSADAADTQDLSDADTRPNDASLKIMELSLQTERNAALASGGVDPATADLLDKLLKAPDGKPSALCLSMAEDTQAPMGFELWRALRNNKPLNLDPKAQVQALSMVQAINPETKLPFERIATHYNGTPV